jgi:glycerol-3-phosphate dehydrogenase
MPGTILVVWGVSMADAEVAAVGAGVVGSAIALALSRRGVSVVLLDAEPEPGLAASGTNSGILHTGFDSPPGELETELILKAAKFRDPMLRALAVPVLRCGAVVRPLDDSQREAVAALAGNADRNGVEARLTDNRALEVPGEAATDPIAFTAGLAAAAVRHGADLLTSFRVAAIAPGARPLRLEAEDGRRVECRVAVNCAGLYADRVARLAGDDSFEIYPRKGEFLVFDPPGETLERILLPVPTKRTKGVLVFPTVDGKVVAGPTAVDQDDKEDWSVRPEASDEILREAIPMLPALESAEPVGAYAGLRPAGRGVNYLIGPSGGCPGLVNVAAIRSTGLTASLGIAERVAGIIGALGVRLGPERALEPGSAPAPSGPWWRRVAEYRSR